MPGLNVHAEVFVPMSARHSTVAIEAKEVEEVSAQGTSAEVNTKALFDKHTWSNFTDSACLYHSIN